MIVRRRRGSNADAWGLRRHVRIGVELREHAIA
jgi:hypothetical protein